MRLVGKKARVAWIWILHIRHTCGKFL